MIEKKLVLDTCALLWLVSGDQKLSRAALAAIDRASVVYVSAISAWEISLKRARGELVLPMDPLEWFNLAMDKHSLVAVPVDASIACRANALPFHHRDQTDRFIIATSIELSSAVVTADANFEKYGIKVIA